jgi:hypothetical protein
MHTIPTARESIGDGFAHFAALLGASPGKSDWPHFRRVAGVWLAYTIATMIVEALATGTWGFLAFSPMLVIWQLRIPALLLCNLLTLHLCLRYQRSWRVMVLTATLIDTGLRTLPYLAMGLFPLNLQQVALTVIQGLITITLWGWAFAKIESPYMAFYAQGVGALVLTAIVDVIDNYFVISNGPFSTSLTVEMLLQGKLFLFGRDALYLVCLTWLVVRVSGLRAAAKAVSPS